MGRELTKEDYKQFVSNPCFKELELWIADCISEIESTFYTCSPEIVPIQRSKAYLLREILAWVSEKCMYSKQEMDEILGIEED